MRSFYILNERALSDANLPAPEAKRERLRYRDMIWAFHSESQDLLLNASVAACKGKMTWTDARALGVPLWLTSIETLVSAHGHCLARSNAFFRGNNLRSLLVMSICLTICATRQGARYTTSHWGSISSSMDFGGRPRGTKSSRRCSSFCPTTSLSLDGRRSH